MKPFLRSKLVLTVTTLVLIAAGTLIMLPGQQAVHAASGDWPALLANDGRTGFNGAETIIKMPSRILCSGVEQESMETSCG